MTELIGSFGSFCLIVCNLPQVWKAWKEGHADGLSLGFLWLWFGGVGSMFVYNALTYKDTLLFLNYGMGVASVAVLIYYRYRGAGR